MDEPNDVSDLSGTARSGWGAARRAALLLGIASVLALACTAAIFAFVARADFLTATAAAVVDLMNRHGVLAGAAAASPLFAALLVGYAYMQRGIRRRAAEKAAAARDAGASATTPSPSRRT